MKRLVLVLMAASFLTACGSNEQKSDNEKAGADSGVIDKAQEGMNEVIDTMQSKGDKLADTLKKHVIEPVKADVKKAGEKIKEAANEVKEKVKQE
ncbi:hypothetical protein ESA94_04465 [Lacibacter luteus]|uniref:YtxH domain-containing protein n=1 Tax=Lacibacter luteus TaxID=2508719 RepID=A0A4Q1CML7_9BACT|nr:hypothetical protein [Lacibacter luteus]RXK62270.1 hypothetical protein ESA94_04465 [Lacibacter luteus]